MELFFIITQFIQESLAALGVGLVGGWVLFKRLTTHTNKETLESTKAKAETNVINLISERITNLESTNNNLSKELTELRNEYSKTLQLNHELKLEIKSLRLFIEQNFRPSFSETGF